ncbi:hypothetical protein D3C86_1344150 [compost metagenome]
MTPVTVYCSSGGTTSDFASRWARNSSVWGSEMLKLIRIGWSVETVVSRLLDVLT